MSFDHRKHRVKLVYELQKTTQLNLYRQIISNQTNHRLQNNCSTKI